MPTLLIWGELDVRSPLSIARRFEQAIPNAELVVIPGCGHVSNLERPEQFSAAVRRVSAGYPPPGYCTRPELATRVLDAHELPQPDERGGVVRRLVVVGLERPAMVGVG